MLLLLAMISPVAAGILHVTPTNVWNFRPICLVILNKRKKYILTTFQSCVDFPPAGRISILDLQRDLRSV